MSQYRDDRDAARLRIEALEGALSEREAELAALQRKLSMHEAELVRLRREILAHGGERRRALPRGARLAGLCLSLAVILGGLGVFVLRRSAPVSVSVQPAPAVVEAPILADPGTMLGQQEGLAETAAPLETFTPRPDGRVWGETLHGLAPAKLEAMRRTLEPRVFGGRAGVDEIKMLKAICAHQGDRPCRDRAAAALERALDEAR